ncbi:ABC transporter substrate-binding protein [Sulfobacillus thermosulfidooxidans]|uniref:ABC transporter substrate-binding protein n=1 Tax=Sulfobacillus thermosulfidooxidans TaxID=28034 RepID=UPI0006B60FB1|nr:ABC transporter substrate-binding protein [Sulfobacillus thermosulfidooxidans]
MDVKTKSRVIVMATILSLSLLAAGCGSTSTTSSSSPSGGTSNGKLIIGYEADATSLDPGQVTDINSGQVLNQMYDTLVQYNSQGQLIPDLATSWSSSPNHLQYTFTLRKGVRFSNGDPLTPASVVYSFERMLNPQNPGYKYGPYPFGAFFYGDISNVTADGNDKVIFSLKQPEASFLQSLTVLTGAIVDPKVALQDGKTFSLHGAGTGPYMLESWQRGQQLVLKPNPYYWGPKPQLSKVVFVPIVQSSERATDLESGSVNMVVNPAPVDLSQIRAAGDVVQMQAGPHIWWIGMNLLQAPFSSVKVRQALNYAINRTAITKNILYGTGIPADQPLSPDQMGYNPHVNPYHYNPQKAKQLLAEAGYPNGFTATLLVPTSGSGMQNPVSMATAIQGELAQIGVKINIEQIDWGTFLNKIAEGAKAANLQMWELSWMDSAVDPSLVLNPLLASSSWPPGFNTGFYKDPRVDALLQEAELTPSDSERAKLYQEAEALINHDAPWIFVDHAKAVVAYSPSVKGFHLNPTFPFYINLRGVSMK